MTTPTETKRRPFLSISGWLLFVCLFLPTLKVCGTPEAPISFPPVYGVYLGGLLVAFLAGSRTLRSRKAMFVLLSFVYYATFACIGAIIATDVAQAIGAVAILGGLGGALVLVGVLTRVTIGPRVVAWGCLVHAMVACLWCGLIAGDKEAVWGAYVGFGAAVAMLVLAIGFVVDEHRQAIAARLGAQLPVARTL
jgi:hypothetical protein